MNGLVMQKIIHFYQRIYDFLCGTHPHRYPWHSQWLSVKDLYRDLRRVLPTLEGRLLDVGCRSKPYAYLLTRATEHIGIDVELGTHVDHVISDGVSWPLKDESFQSALCTQVIQMVPNHHHLISEIHRVLCNNGIAVITIPFCYHDMTTVYNGALLKDLGRYSIIGAQELIHDSFEVIEIRTQGGIGSTTGMMLLNWIQMSLTRRNITYLMMIALFPLWITLCFVVNMIGLLCDKLDRTDSFYHNVLMVMRKYSR
jgi:hypothetical protein